MSTAPIKTSGTLTVKPKRDLTTDTDRLRYIDKKGRYLLQVRDSALDPWRNVPFVGSLSDVQVCKP